MAEAHSRGYLHDSGHQVDPELLTGWDHSKPKGTSKNAKKTDAEESAILLKSRAPSPEITASRQITSDSWNQNYSTVVALVNS